MNKSKCCAYCGRWTVIATDDHAIPKRLYPFGDNEYAHIQRITVPACFDCNNGFSEDEEHFRSVLLLAGDANSAVQRIWPAAVRGFRNKGGQKRVEDVSKLLETVSINGMKRLKIYPGRDPRVLRIVRKIVRGLSHHHKIESAIADDRVFADVLTTAIPKEFLESVDWHHQAEGIVKYFYYPFFDDEVTSVWYFRFYQRTEFIAVVYAHPMK